MVDRFDLGDRLLRHCSLMAARQVALAMIGHPRRFPPPWSAEETDACFIVNVGLPGDDTMLGMGSPFDRGPLNWHQPAPKSGRPVPAE
jgi:hypothetical protein